LLSPDIFVREFFAAANEAPPRGSHLTDDTRWFGERMHDLAGKAGLQCQNKQSPRSGEWMNIDHVLVRSDTFAAFPVVAVEHENRDASEATKRGQMPTGTTKSPHIEWALWKVLAMRAKLSVLVAYPWEKDRDSVLKILAEIVAGFRNEYGMPPPALLLLGWWQLPRNATWMSAEFLYRPYVPVDRKGTVALVPLS